MIKALLSRYSVRYVPALVYILQASEYKLGAYFEWYFRVKNFSRVQQRKTLVKTPKALLLVLLGWVLLLAMYAASVVIFFGNAGVVSYVLGVLALLLSPYLLPYILVIPLFLINLVVQKPIEHFIIKSAKQKLAEHKGFKIAIAGSFGKTSMREILKTVLSEGKKVAAPPHSYNTPLGISKFIQNLQGDEEILLFELGEYYPGDVRTLCELVQPDLGVITGVNEAHLEKFKKIERTVATIFELADFLGGKPVYVNAENALAKAAVAQSHILYSREGVENMQIKDASTSLEGTSFTLSIENSEMVYSSQLLGLHQVGPLGAAVAIAMKMGLSEESIKAGVAKTKPFDHRLEPKVDGHGVTILDDSYNGNPDGVKAVIDFLASLKGKRRFYVTPGLVEVGSRTEDVHIQIGKWLATAEIENIVLIRNSVSKYIEVGLEKSGYNGKIWWFDNALAAFAALPNITLEGDVVLLQNDWPDQYY